MLDCTTSYSYFVYLQKQSWRILRIAHIELMAHRHNEEEMKQRLATIAWWCDNGLWTTQSLKI